MIDVVDLLGQVSAVLQIHQILDRGQDVFLMQRGQIAESDLLCRVADTGRILLDPFVTVELELVVQLEPPDLRKAASR